MVYQNIFRASRRYEKKVKYPGDDAKNLFDRYKNTNGMRLITVVLYLLFVSLAAILLSSYYIFFWDPQPRPQIVKPPSNCDKVVLAETVAIKLANSTTITAEYYFKEFYQKYQADKLAEEIQKLLSDGKILSDIINNRAPQILLGHINSTAKQKLVNDQIPIITNKQQLSHIFVDDDSGIIGEFKGGSGDSTIAKNGYLYMDQENN